jgi:hypothetical protein
MVHAVVPPLRWVGIPSAAAAYGSAPVLLPRLRRSRCSSANSSCFAWWKKECLSRPTPPDAARRRPTPPDAWPASCRIRGIGHRLFGHWYTSTTARMLVIRVRGRMRARMGVALPRAVNVVVLEWFPSRNAAGCGPRPAWGRCGGGASGFTLPAGLFPVMLGVCRVESAGNGVRPSACMLKGVRLFVFPGGGRHWGLQVLHSTVRTNAVVFEVLSYMITRINEMETVRRANHWGS